MYRAFYGLRERPFDLTADPRYLFLAPRQREVLSNLRYGLTTPRGFTLLVGEAGTGKTTLVRAALGEVGEHKCHCVVLSNPTLHRAEFYEFLGRAFGLSDAASTSKTRFLSELQTDLQERFSAGGLTGLVIDEAQSLPHELMEEIRLLGNIETTSVTNVKLLNIVLAGQPELADRLNEPSLRQLKQRISLRCELTVLDLNETADYVAGRVRIAGGTPAEVFTQESVVAIYQASGGLPRTINVLCDNALISGFAVQVKPVTARIIREVCEEFDIPMMASPAAGGHQAGTPQPVIPAGHIRAVPRLEGPRVTEAESERPMFDAVGDKRRSFFF